MALQRALWLLVTFPLLSLANFGGVPPDSTVIGYRKVSSTSVNTFRSFNNQPVWNKDTQEDERYGPGIYLRGNLEDAAAASEPGLPCAFFANERAIRSAQKVIVPNKMRLIVEDATSSNDDMDSIDVTAGDSRFDLSSYLEYKSHPKNDYMELAIRIARLADNYLIVIPPKQMNHNGGKLRLKVFCRDSVEELNEQLILAGELPKINYRDKEIWEEELVGNDGDWNFWDETRYA